MAEINTNWCQSVGGVVLRDGRVLLARHTYGAGKGRLIIPGGYVQMGESPEDALRRAEEHLSRIRSGECAAAPARMEQSNPCTWCDWHKICLFDDRLDGSRARRLKSLQPDEAMLKIKSESDGESREKL